MSAGSERPRVAVIGSGVSGLTAAYLLRRRYEVTLFEAADRLGGNAHTHSVHTADGRDVAVDSGFIVHNERTYPQLTRLFDELGVATRPTEMSMSVRCEGCGLEYAGAKRLRGLFARPGNAGNPRYLGLLAQVSRFHHLANSLLDTPAEDESLPTLATFLRRGRFSEYFINHFALPLVSAVWSADGISSGRYPARYLFRFLRNHGMLSVRGSPSWRFIPGGAREYVERVANRLHAVRRSTPIRTVLRSAEGVSLWDEAGHRHQARHAVLACPADTALGMLDAPEPAEKELLGAFGYSENEAWLHTDSAVLPHDRAARASWNYTMPSCGRTGNGVRISYHMNRLMRLAEPKDYLVTLNAGERIRSDSVLARMTYRHPIYTPEAVAAQRRLDEIGDHRIRFAGAYQGWGFHEDGCVSGVRAAAALGAGW
ncbi:hypothetical protein SAMN04487905_104356 [Actinopolyspora xinjiangensis]|uniref:Amine oxidase domain-containing protein n=1 Tax=Actinopolyspora xinjiangensis TaxID=405564 RepID=A0A1H0T6L8_9ACTN|nr:FAD-dependent oxidoreductase [Actinopolyspora xinjiangensis]SDP49380.1 hypothetical protein SAMN04487905_104356 [Actinopolyspora xinjiangensis]